MPPKNEYLEFRHIYRTELLDNVLPFWLEHSLDKQFGGYFSCLARDGSVYDTDKFVWMQGRELWALSKLYNVYGGAPRCLEAAELGAAFLREHAFAPDKDVYFALKRDGQPLVVPYNIFSECFVCAGLAEYFRATEEEWARTEAARLYRRILERRSNPKGVWTKGIAGARSLCPLNMTMIQFMLYREMDGIVDDDERQAVLEDNIGQFFDRHVDRENHRVLERVLPDGSHLFEHMEGRLMTPGHALETLWFLMDIAAGLNRDEMVADLAEIMLWVIDQGWDESLGGIPVYKDALGMPGEKLEANQRHWWVHVEALCAFLLAHRLTGSREHWAWFKRIHTYTFAHFPDREFGEWYGYLDRRGDPEFTVKGSKWKTLYHLPRALMQCEQWLGELAANAL